MISFSDKALKKLTKKLKSKNFLGVRLSLIDDGCAGYKYNFDYANTPEVNDIELSFKHFKLWLPKNAQDKLLGTTINWKKEGLNEEFYYSNPQETTACGCGISVGF